MYHVKESSLPELSMLKITKPKKPTSDPDPLKPYQNPDPKTENPPAAAGMAALFAQQEEPTKMKLYMEKAAAFKLGSAVEAHIKKRFERKSKRNRIKA